jgi:mannan endo-1,4-beta-mannosidase
MDRRYRVFGILTSAALAATLAFPLAAAAAKTPAKGDFVQRNGATLNLNGQPFRFVGTNNYYLMYSSHLMVDDVLNAAAANGFTVMRTWGWLDGTPKNGIWFQNLVGGTMAYNDGATGLGNLDYTVAQAGKLGLKLVIPFTGNWGDFGGEDQYVAWAGGSYHDDFYTNPQIKTWYKAWISHLLNHVNSITGVAYKNDPTIMTWELANEPRCVGSGTYPASANCNTSTITNWAAEMSAYTKSIDSKQLVSSGSEGFLCIPGSTEYERDCASGVDELAISKLPTIDVMSYHLYPDGGWNKSVSWGTTWIKDHIALAHEVSKPSMLGEFGLKDKAIRDATYQTWTDTVRHDGGTGALFWILTGKQDDGSLYPDYDGFRVTCPSPNCTTLANAAIALKDPGLYPKFPPVADNLSAVVEFGQTWDSTPAASAIAYGAGNAVVASTIDLDPATAGQQTSITGTGGTFALQLDGTVLFTPATGYNGPASASYTITDKKGRVSNVATLSVIVKQQPGTPVQLFSFETGTQGFGGTVSQSSAWASDGTFSLLDQTDGNWISAAYPGPDLSVGYSAITLDALNATPNWGYVKISIQAGPSWTWCEGTGVSLQPQASGPMTIPMDLTTTTCDLRQIHQINIYISTATYIDNVWAK